MIKIKGDFQHQTMKSLEEQGLITLDLSNKKVELTPKGLSYVYDWAEKHPEMFMLLQVYVDIYQESLKK